MSIHKIRSLFVTAVLGAVVAAPITASAGEGQRSDMPCFLQQYRIVSVRPFHVNEQTGRATFRRMRGAWMFLEAESGLTPQWLLSKLRRHLRTMSDSDMGDCALDVDGVRVEVVPADVGFWVKLIADDRDEANEVLRRARLLVEGVLP